MAKGDKKPIVMQSDRAVPGGVATLGADGKLAQMPSAADVGAPSLNSVYKTVNTRGWYRVGTIPAMGAWRFVCGGGWNVDRPCMTIVDMVRSYSSTDIVKIVHADSVGGLTQIRFVDIGSSQMAVDVYYSYDTSNPFYFDCVTYHTSAAFTPVESVELITDEVTPALTFSLV